MTWDYLYQRLDKRRHNEHLAVVTDPKPDVLQYHASQDVSLDLNIG